jgi:prepilin-type N-terminal cleavage/methylation domain-containing protein
MSSERNKFTAGFTIAELLISLAVVGILLAAVAVAFNASIINYRENNDIFNAVNSARQALLRITTQLRTANKVFVDGETVAQCSMEMETAQGQLILIRYQYNSGDKTLYLETNGNSYVLCKNVAYMRFEKTKATNNSFAKSVQISITVAAGDIQRTLSAAAVIRRNLN